ncbi:hypothetical protein [Actinacidiphila sp. bgisy160]|uniref:hypothetical protein n=1 Tax=Actinacidiphila sp. bgisy160 TaxID=3413796 RepID=UPI003D7526BB
MIDQDGGLRRGRALADGLSPADAACVHREALRVLRPDLDSAHVDAYCDRRTWPAEALSSYGGALTLAREAVAAGTRSRRADPGMGIDIDVRDDAQFGLLLDLVPYTIHAEGRRAGRTVFTADDSGAALWIAVTRAQEAELLKRLAARGIAATALSARGR